MRKLLLLITALLTLGVSGAWADVTQPTLTTDANNPVYYTIKNFRSQNYATYTGASSQLSQESTPTDASLWYFVENGNGVSIVPDAAPTLKLATHSRATASGDVWYLVENPYNTGYFCVSLTSGATANCWDDQTSHTRIGFWQPASNDYEGTSWILEKAYPVSLPKGKFLSIGGKTNTFSAISSASDNDHWYLITQNRINGNESTYGEDTPIYNVGTGSNIQRASISATPTTLNGASVELHAQYLVRFINAGEGVYNIQFGDGDYVKAPASTPGNGTTIVSTAVRSEGDSYAFYNTVPSGTTFGWNLGNNTGKIVDNNGRGGNIVFWESGAVSAESGNNVWYIYPVNFTDITSLSYTFDTSNGAFFQSLTTNKAAANNVYCNLWLSKNSADKPQLKLITSDATSSAGNNIRSNGALYTKNGSYAYNLSVSEGKIKSYTIVGTAEGALSITPEGGSAEEFAQDATVNKKVTLITPAKQTSFTLSGSNQFLSVEKFIIEWETDATIVTSVGEISNDGIYMLEPHNAERGMMYAGTEYLDACGGHANSNYPANKNVPIDASDENQQFVIYTYNGNKYLYNIGRAKFVGTASDLYYQLTNTPINKWTVTDGTYSNYFHLTSQADSKMATINAWVGGAGINIANPKDYGVTGATVDEEANNLLLTRVGTLTSEQQTTIESIISDYEVLMTNLDKLDAYTVGTGLGEYTNADFTSESFKDDNISTIRAAVANYDAATLSGIKNSSTNSISKMIINQPSSGSFIRIKSSSVWAATPTYLTSSNSASDNSRCAYTQTVSEIEGASTILCYIDDNLVGYSTGYKMNSGYRAPWNTAAGDGTTVSFQAAANGTIGKYNITFSYNSSTRYLYANKDNLYSDSGGSSPSGSNTEGYNFELESVTSLPITFKGQFASFFGPVDLTLADGVKAYTGTLNGDNTILTLTEVDYVPANTGVILEYEAFSSETTLDFPILSTVTPIDDTSLTGSTAAQNVAADSKLVLGKSDDNWGIYKYSGTTLGGFKAYMDMPETPVKGFAFTFGDADAIANVLNGEENTNEVYDLSGRRVNAPARGLYIVNGKKVVIK